jgi:flagellar basal body-associated protein FliL
MRRLAAAAAVVVLAAAGITVFLVTRSKPLDRKVASAYVQAQAHALCVVQSHSYRTHAALQDAYSKAQANGSLSAKDLARARDAAEKDEQLRRRITSRVAELCG